MRSTVGQPFVLVATDLGHAENAVFNIAGLSAFTTASMPRNWYETSPMLVLPIAPMSAWTRDMST